MRVVIFSPFFFPEEISTGRYNTALARELVQGGATVEVFASHPVYPSWHPRRSADQLPGMHINRGGAWMRYPVQQALRRILLEVWFASHVALSLLLKRPRADRIVVIFPPVLLALAIRCFMPGRIPRIGIVHDLQGVMARNGLVRSIARWMERRALGSCDKLVFLSNSMARRATSLYGLASSSVVVHYPFLTLLPACAPGHLLENELPEGAIHVVYSGALGEKQEPERLFGFMSELVARNPSLRCHIFSDGPHFERLRANANLTGSRVEFHGLVPERALAELYARSTIQVVPQARGTGDGALPSKLPNLIAAGVPVFLICDEDSEAAALVRQAAGSVGCSADVFDSPETFRLFDGFLDAVLHQSRASRIQSQRDFVRRMFGVAAVVEEILKPN